MARNHVSPAWTDEQIEKLREWASRGNTAKQMVFMLLDAFGVERSRDAVIRTCHRFGIQLQTGRRAGPNQGKKRPSGHARRKAAAEKAPPPPPKPKPVPIVLPPRAELVNEVKQEALRGRGKPFIEAGLRDCRYPVHGEGASMIVCAAPVLDGMSYCATCYLITHTALDKGVSPFRLSALAVARRTRVAA